MNLLMRRNFIDIPSIINRGSPLSSLGKKVYSERKLMNFSQNEMFQIVSNVTEYKNFVPWCQKSIVYDEQTSLVPNRHHNHLLKTKTTSKEHTEMEKKENKFIRKSTKKADLTIGFKDISETYTSRVTCLEPFYVEALSQDSRLFKLLRNTWNLTPAIPDSLLHSLSTTTRSTLESTEFPLCQVDFYVEFEFHSTLYASISSFYLDQVANQMINSFESRAIQMFGSRKHINTIKTVGRGQSNHVKLNINKLMEDFNISRGECMELEDKLNSFKS